jgi:carboxyl-terminal processing protease
MHKIAQFIMSKKFIPVILGLTAISLFFTYQSQGKNDNNENPKEKHTRVLRNVRILLEDGHFSPQKIDDIFSKKVFKKFIEELDDEKDIFIKSDISSFKKYENKIDDEMLGSPLISFYIINELYQKRAEEVASIYTAILQKPMDFNLDEKVQLDAEKSDFPKNEKERYDIWRKRMKYAVLSKYVDLQEDREKNKDKKDYIIKADSTLEREARDQVRKQMQRYFTTKKTRETEDENFSTFINSITSLMDPHTNYFPPIDLRSFNESMSGRFYGIGAQLKEDDGKIVITSLVSGGPAWKGGELKENDEIIKVAQGNAEPVDVTGYSVTDAVKLIRGSEKGSEVRLTVKKVDGSIKIISILRDDIKLEDTFAKSAIINGKNKIGYIYLPEFYADFERPNGARCANDVAKEVEKLKEEKVDAIILDLRGNGGGSLYDVVQMAGLFIKNGPICQVKGREENPNILKDRDDRIQYDGPLAVMVDGTSASASEIFAAAIQDYKRGIIIGSTSTYGKGTVQRNIPLNPDNDITSILGKKKNDDMGSVKLTLQKFYRVNGGATQIRGVVPDVILPNRYDYLKFREMDNPSALPWDEIQKAEFNIWNNSFDFNKVVASINQDVKNNPTFNEISNQSNWLKKNSEREYSLNLLKYKQEQKELKDVLKKLDDLNKSSDSLNFQIPEVDLQDVNSSEEKIDKNKQWIKFRKNDIYIEQTMKSLDKIILQNSMVKSKD